MNSNIEYFIKDDYKVLKILKDHEIELMGRRLSPLSQNDLSHITVFSKAKINDIVNNLIKAGYLEYIEYGKYSLTAKGSKAVERLEHE